MIRTAFWVFCSALIALVFAVVFFVLSVIALCLSPFAAYVQWSNTRKVVKAIQSMKRTGPKDGFSEAGN